MTDERTLAEIEREIRAHKITAKVALQYATVARENGEEEKAACFERMARQANRRAARVTDCDAAIRSG